MSFILCRIALCKREIKVLCFYHSWFVCVQDTEKGKFVSELYRGHLMASADGRTLLMATDRLIGC